MASFERPPTGRAATLGDKLAVDGQLGMAVNGPDRGVIVEGQAITGRPAGRASPAQA